MTSHFFPRELPHHLQAARTRRCSCGAPQARLAGTQQPPRPLVLRQQLPLVVPMGQVHRPRPQPYREQQPQRRARCCATRRCPCTPPSPRPSCTCSSATATCCWPAGRSGGRGHRRRRACHHGSRKGLARLGLFGSPRLLSDTGSSTLAAFLLFSALAVREESLLGC